MLSIRRCLFALPTIALLAIGTTAHAEKTIVETAVNAGSFKTLVAAVGAADLADTLSSPGPFTVFAPTDEAFAKLPAGTIESLLKPANKSKLAKILTYHVLPGRVTAADVVKLTGAKTVAGEKVRITASDSGVKVNDAAVVQTDITCSNGVIHVIDNVLLPASQTIPEVASASGQFGTLLAAANAAGLVPTLSGAGPLTVFAPTDEAFTALPAGTVAELLKPENKAKLAEILKYHVVAGRVYSEDALALSSAPTVAGPSISITPTDGGANINGARLVATDIDASNGVIHVIDRVLLPSDAPPSSIPANDNRVAAMKPSVDTRAVAKAVIADAIHRGVPVYNAGDHHGCATIYMQALQSVASMQACGWSDHTQNQMQQTLTQCQQMTSATDRAWSLRHRLDQITVGL
ncbi:fasciclin domain-containing protein [Planctomycetes bacterium K23_9]|uniref:Immunogenic protein MPT70 n=1 Tax=Stieleria marina TaxID=1930275 RepID=A0A517P089_9BACT|nr:Immunogenic protein MPT70 precursor [Planctomycetes bacterium K23_9]